MQGLDTHLVVIRRPNDRHKPHALEFLYSHRTQQTGKIGETLKPAVPTSGRLGDRGLPTGVLLAVGIASLQL